MSVSPELAYAYTSCRQAAAGGDALALVADRATIIRAAELLERAEMRAWSADDQTAAARELRALADAYHPLAED